MSDDSQMSVSFLSFGFAPVSSGRSTRTASEDKKEVQCLAVGIVPCSVVGIVGISDGLSRFAANAIKISAFPIPRQNNKKYPFL